MDKQKPAESNPDERHPHTSSERPNPSQVNRYLVEDEFRQWLQVGIDQADRGEVAEWNTAEILAEARRRYLSS